MAVLLVGLALIGAPGAGACSVVAPGPTDQELLARADLVFEGVARSSVDPNAGQAITGSGDPIVWTFDVGQVLKGPVTHPQQVSTARSTASCGFNFEVGQAYLVYAQLVNGAYVASLGNGTRPIVPPGPTTTATSTTTTRPPAGPATSVANRPGPVALTG